MLDSTVTFAARAFAIERHGDQKRKYTGEPYWHHCVAVASEVCRRGGNHTLISAAYLHDVVEDTETTLGEIESLFGVEVAALVGDLTDRYTTRAYPHLNRKTRKRLECERWKNCSPEAKLIKLCDLIDNTGTIIRHDPSFAIVYLREKADLLEAMGY